MHFSVNLKHICERGQTDMFWDKNTSVSARASFECLTLRRVVQINFYNKLFNAG